MSGVGHGAPELVLASASPRRLQLLRGIGVEPSAVRAADADERPLDGEKPAELVERLADAKARLIAGAQQLGAGPGGDAATGQEDLGDRLVVGADTVIDLDGEILGKPVDRADGRRMLEALSGRAHDVVTGVAVVGRLAGRPVAARAVERTAVTVRRLDAADLDWYLDSGEYDGKAGAYAIQGLGALLVSGIEGSYDNVVGLPLVVLDRLLTDLGLPLRELVS